MKRYFTLFFFYCFLLSSYSQTRYLDSLFTVTRHADIVYGQNYDNQDSLWQLLMDVYEPTNDTASLRPIIYFVHGGSFIEGDRNDQQINKIAQHFAQKGYVTANIEYRLEQSDLPSAFLNFVDANNWYKAIARATQDLKASIRYIKKNVATNGNQYKVDTTKIFIYGSSAGAIAALHAVYLDDTAEMRSSVFKSSYIALGGLDGNSGNAGYSSTAGIKAIVSCSGAIQATEWLDNNTDISYIGFHNNIDPVVPFGTGCFDVAACWLGYYHGANDIYPRTRSLGMTSEFYPINSAGHPVDRVADAATRTLVLQKTADFLYKILNPSIVTSVRNNTIKNVEVFPNPSTGNFTIQFPKEIQTKNAVVEILNIEGKKLYSNLVRNKEFFQMQLDIPNGSYIVSITSDEQNYLSKITINK